MFSMMSEADRLRLSYQIFYKQIKFADLPKTNKLLTEERFGRIDKAELLMDFLKRHRLMKDLSALHSRSRAVNMMREYKETGKFPSHGLMEHSVYAKTLLMPVEKIRSYYGDSIAVYFEFMNFFLRWMTIPAIYGLVTYVCNKVVFEDPS